MNDFEKNILSKIDNGKNLTEDEISTLVWEYEIEQNEGACHRWTQCMESISEIGGRYFSIDWDRGLTEYQEHEYNYQPHEVKPIKYIRKVVVEEYIDIDTDEEKYLEKCNGERVE